MGFRLLLLILILFSCDKKKETLESRSNEDGTVRLKVLELSLVESFKDIFRKDSLPEEILLASKKYQISYSIDEKLEERVKRLLLKWKPRYAAVTVINNDSGEILAAIDYSRKTNSFSRKLAFSSKQPAASIIKIISAAALIENGRVSRTTPFYFNGRSTTLYRSQLEDKRNKWTRKTSFGKAFSFSNNVVFAKAILKYGHGKMLREMAEKFEFGRKTLNFAPLNPSYLFEPDSSFELAELATGFNRRTLVSPVHTSLIASIIANRGVLKDISFVKEIREQGHSIWSADNRDEKRVLSEQTSVELEKMMVRVVKSGTARKMFRKYPSRTLDKLIIAGKTGSITGGEPHGKRDWFVSYGKPRKGKSSGISVSVMLILGRNWKVRSTLIGRDILDFYFKDKIK